MGDCSKYRRPRLCRLCQGPVVDGGVLACAQRLDRLCRWWKAHWDTDLERKQLKICHFCAWELRFADESSDVKESVDKNWWPNPNIKAFNANNYKFYKDELTKSCSVNIAPLADFDKYLEEYLQSQPGQHYKCLYCPRSFSYVQVLESHAKRCHIETIFFCKVNLCRKYFSTEKEKKTHMEKEHPQRKPVNCVSCNKIIKGNLSYHLGRYHKGQVIRCRYYPSCKTIFKTEKEQNEHFDKEHNFGNFFCCFCVKYFENPSTLYNHMKAMHIEALKCNGSQNCPTYFKTEEDKQKHIKEKHPVGRQHKCLYCPATYTCHDMLHRHVKREHKDTFIRCERFKCPTYFKSKEERQKHYDEYHEKNKFFCIYCDKVIGLREGEFSVHLKKFHSKDEIFRCPYKYCPTFYKNDEERRDHIKQVHEQSQEEKHRCVYCGLFAKSLWGHMRYKHTEIAINCSYSSNCPTFFKTIEDREKHIKEVHQKIRRPVSCCYCSKILEGELNLKAHVTNMHLDIAIKCQNRRCRQFFKSQAELENHYVSYPEHKKNPPQKASSINLPRSFCCNLCPKAYPSLVSLKCHKRIVHEGRKRATCSHCQKPIDCKTTHIVSPICRICNKSFPCMGLLTQHKSTCKPIFQCPVCAKTFMCNATLQNHCKSIHTAHIQQWRGLQHKSRGHKCRECLTYYKSRNNLHSHVKKQHKNSISTCNFCSKQFSKRLNLKKHIVKYHLKK